ncbi:hypothetical protein ACIBQ1_41705 [Nonomuraea sp. NPDC050153]
MVADASAAPGRPGHVPAGERVVTIRVVVADDQDPVRAALRAMLTGP